MSILIKGMEMPFAGSIKTIVIYPDGIVCTRRQDPLPYTAVPVPDDVRLIDANALRDSVISKYVACERNFELTFATCEVKQDVVDMIENAPTIIPADPEEEENNDHR